MLVSVVTITLIIVNKLGGKIFQSGLQPDRTLIFVASFLFVTLLITHLFKEQSWTGDILKVLIGVLLGVGSSSLATSKKIEDKAITLSGNEIKDSVVNQAMRDINQKFDNFNSQLSKFENAVINQSIEQSKTLVRRTERMRLETEDHILISRLRTIQQMRSDHWTWQWIEECVAYPEFNEQLNNKIESLSVDGWVVSSMNFDNTASGIHINLEIVKPFTKYGPRR